MVLIITQHDALTLL